MHTEYGKRHDFKYWNIQNEIAFMKWSRSSNDTIQFWWLSSDSCSNIISALSLSLPPTYTGRHTSTHIFRSLWNKKKRGKSTGTIAKSEQKWNKAKMFAEKLFQTKIVKSRKYLHIKFHADISPCVCSIIKWFFCQANKSKIVMKICYIHFSCNFGCRFVIVPFVMCVCGCCALYECRFGFSMLGCRIFILCLSTHKILMYVQMFKSCFINSHLTVCKILFDVFLSLRMRVCVCAFVWWSTRACEPNESPFSESNILRGIVLCSLLFKCWQKRERERATLEQFPFSNLSLYCGLRMCVSRCINKPWHTYL